MFATAKIKNGGYGFGNNVGIKYSVETLNADYVLIANPDVIFENDLIEKNFITKENFTNSQVLSTCFTTNTRL